MDDRATIWAPEDFRRVAERLGVRVITPYALDIPGIDASAVMFIPDFGSERGAIAWVGNVSAVPNGLSRAVRADDMFLSLMNMDSGPCDDQYVKDTLDDWQFFGPTHLRPGWYTGTNWNDQPPRCPA
ncbi:MAG: hypothetical protein ACKVU4_02245 [Phycisphaerales bacterium]